MRALIAVESFTPVDVLPGQTGTWKVAFAVPTKRPADFALAVEYRFAKPIYWTGTV